MIYVCELCKAERDVDSDGCKEVPLFCSACEDMRRFYRMDLLSAVMRDLRDEFAMAALSIVFRVRDVERFDLIASDAYLLADAMMKARSEKIKD